MWSLTFKCVTCPILFVTINRGPNFRICGCFCRISLTIISTFVGSPFLANFKTESKSLESVRSRIRPKQVPPPMVDPKTRTCLRGPSTLRILTPVPIVVGCWIGGLTSRQERNHQMKSGLFFRRDLFRSKLLLPLFCYEHWVMRMTMKINPICPK